MKRFVYAINPNEALHILAGESKNECQRIERLKGIAAVVIQEKMRYFFDMQIISDEFNVALIGVLFFSQLLCVFCRIHFELVNLAAHSSLLCNSLRFI